jgi:MYXO-CTERM domain-containing protein
MLWGVGAVAWACGGFMCDAAQPVEQAGEEVIFSVDESAQQVTMHVRVAYQGPAEEFGWVIPVKGTPDVFLSHEALFAVVDQLTAPLYFTVTDFGDCSQAPAFASSTGGDFSTATADSGSDPSVWVLDRDTVGAYETVTLGATDTTALVAWLQENDYDVPSSLDQALAPYLANGMNFLALRLRSSGDVGELAPLALRYEGTTPGIPLTLTAVAAAPDMPITVYLLGDARAVPLNTLHTVLNPLAIDYWSFGANLDDVIAAAADEAGGHGFATLAATRSPGWFGPTAGDLDLSGLADLADPADFLRALADRGVPFDQRLIDALFDVLPVPEGYPGGAAAYYAAVTSGEVTPEGAFDPVAAVEALEEQLVKPLADAEALVAGASWLTRLRSSISPEEMTIDPTFAFNADLPEVSATQTVTVEADCTGTNGDPFESPQVLRYPEGLIIRAPSPEELAVMGMSLFEWVSSNTEHPTLRIEQLGPSGPPEVVVDHAGELFLGDASEVGEGAVTGGGGCGCATGGVGGGVALALAGLLAVRRRR